MNMNGHKIIKGITWDHPRGFAPLRAAACQWRKRGDVEVRWEVRTLREFGDTPIEALIDRYDLVVIDHPYVGSAAANRLLAPLDEYTELMEQQRRESVGPAFDSYWYDGHCWSLPVDAAAQVAAWRKDLVDVLGWARPSAILDMARAAAELPDGKWMAVPLCPTDIWCVFLSLSALFSDGCFFTERGVDPAVGEWALAQIQSWKAFLHRDSLGMNPIQALEHMASKDEIVYLPYTFGYTNYSRPGWRSRLVHFGESPRHAGARPCTLMGGAGISISATTAYPNECLEFIRYVLSPEIQKGIYFHEQGQPAHISSWLDPSNDAACSGFFSATLNTMRNAYVRPRPRGFNQFQERAAGHIHEAVVKDRPPKDAVMELNALYQNFVVNG
ncbi:MAG TPA: extracellular solute-binding protein [Puia sp.]|jgi:multiple sugar transport system substrate-binding protein